MGTRGQIVLSTSDHIGNILVVDYRQYRVLTFDSVYEQSGYSLEKPHSVVHEYIRIMMLVLGFATPRHITLLGLGGGSLLRSIHHHLHKCQFHVVELRAKVFEVAKYYFDIPVDNRVKYTISDAKIQLRAAPDASTDIIFSDLFDAYFMSPIQTQKKFVSECFRVLDTDGWLVINFHNLPHARSIFFVTLIEYFSKVFICPGAMGNYILFATKSKNIDVNGAMAKIIKMETELSTPFVPLFQRLENLIP
jgi:spermidine synthase